MTKRNARRHDPAAERMSLKAFWEAVEQRLATRSADELRAILRAMAQATPPAQRRAFLDQLKPARGAPASLKKKLRQDELLDDIDDLIQDIQEAAGDADGWDKGEDDWDDYDSEWGGYYGGDYYDDEDSLGPYHVFVEPVTALFERAQAIFEVGNITLARQTYQKLFEEALQVEDEYGRGVRSEDLTGVAVDESRARYLRAVYETEPLKARPRRLFEQLQQTRGWVSGPRPTLTELIEISPAPLPDQEAFLAAWITLLRKQKGADADAWLREAIGLAHGTAGLADLAQAEGKQRPRAYLDWFEALEAEGQDQAVLAEARAALKTLPARLPIRAAIADHLCAATVRLGQPDALSAGRWEAFAAKPTLLRLLDLWEAAPEATARTPLMRRAAQHIAAYLAHPPRSDLGFEPWVEDQLETPAWIDRSILAHAHILAGDLEAAHEMASKQKALGWSDSDNTQGLVVPLFLVLLSGKPLNALPSNLKGLWQDALAISLSVDDWDLGELDQPDVSERETHKRLERLYAEHLPQLALSPDQQTLFLNGCLKMTQKRVKAIVGEKHRHSYGKAARLMAACAEVLRLRDQAEASQVFVDELRAQFPRHRAFQAELDAAMGIGKRRR